MGVSFHKQGDCVEDAGDKVQPPPWGWHSGGQRTKLREFHRQMAEFSKSPGIAIEIRCIIGKSARNE